MTHGAAADFADLSEKPPDGNGIDFRPLEV